MNKDPNPSEVLSKGGEMASGGRLPAHASSEAATDTQHSAGQLGDIIRQALADAVAGAMGQGDDAASFAGKRLWHALRVTEPSDSEREQEDFLAYKIGFAAGFNASAEGWNGEYPMDDRVAVWLDGKANDFARGQLNRERADALLSAAESRRFDDTMIALSSEAPRPQSEAQPSAGNLPPDEPKPHPQKAS